MTDAKRMLILWEIKWKASEKKLKKRLWKWNDTIMSTEIELKNWEKKRKKERNGFVIYVGLIFVRAGHFTKNQKNTNNCINLENVTLGSCWD